MVKSGTFWGLVLEKCCRKTLIMGVCTYAPKYVQNVFMLMTDTQSFRGYGSMIFIFYVS